MHTGTARSNTQLWNYLSTRSNPAGCFTPWVLFLFLKIWRLTQSLSSVTSSGRHDTSTAQGERCRQRMPSLRLLLGLLPADGCFQTRSTLFQSVILHTRTFHKPALAAVVNCTTTTFLVCFSWMKDEQHHHELVFVSFSVL